MKECTYCGAPATHRDHVEPARKGTQHNRFDIGLIVPACSTCNQLLGDRLYPTVIDRIAFLIERYPVKHRALMRAKDIDARDLGYLDEPLRTQVQVKQAQKDELERKLYHLNQRLREELPRRAPSTEAIDLTTETIVPIEDIEDEAPITPLSSPWPRRTKADIEREYLAGLR